MMSAVSLSFFSLDLLLMEIAVSSSALILYKGVLSFIFRFSQIYCRPEANRETDASRKGSSVFNSSLKALISVRPLS